MTGFIIIIVLFLLNINLNHSVKKQIQIKFYFISENTLKILLFIFLTLSFFLPIESFSGSIILWENISIINFIKAVVTLIVLSLLPGLTLYKIFFPSNDICKRFKIESFFFKLAISPLISFGFLGLLTLILDQIGLRYEFFSITLYLVISLLFLIDIIIQYLRNKQLEFKIIRIEFSKNTLFILGLCIGVITLSIGFQINWLYLISGDPWDTIKFANYIGKTNVSPLDLGTYPNFWGYISFSLSVLSELPIINVNSLLAPFSYLFISSLYLFMKSLLTRFSEKYSVLSTFMISIFSGLFIIHTPSSIIFVGLYYFIYKSYSYFLFFVSMALFLIIVNNHFNQNFESKKMLNIRENMYLLLASCFLIISYMTYMFPLLLALIYIFLFCLFSKERIKNFQVLMLFFTYSFLFFIILDIITFSFLSKIIVPHILPFYDFEFLHILNRSILSSIIIYLVFGIFILFNYLIVVIIKSLKKRENKKGYIRINNATIVFKIILFIFTVLLLIELIISLLENSGLSQFSFFFLFLDKVIPNLGIIGILGIYFSYSFFKKHKNLYLILLSWVVVSFALAFLPLLIELFTKFPASPESISYPTYIIIFIWFDRIWFYCIPALCILASFAFYRIINRIRFNLALSVNKYFKYILLNSFSVVIIVFSFSGIFLSGFVYGDPKFRYTNNQIETLNWISENVPIYSGIVVGDNFFMGVGTDSITFIDQYFLYDIFKPEFNETQCREQIGFLKNNTVQYAVISQFFITYILNKSDFVNNVLVEDFYNLTLYTNGDLAVYYAPFFNVP
ncbi:MAG: hypothetical protein ACFFEY_15710 [Candidatus Thorarchaeota archaeon]